MRAPSPYIAADALWTPAGRRAPARSRCVHRRGLVRGERRRSGAQSADTADRARRACSSPPTSPRASRRRPARTRRHADEIAWRRASSGCGPYITLQKASHPAPAGELAEFGDEDPQRGQRGRRVPVRPRRERDARPLREAEHRRLPREPVEKQARQDPDLEGVDDVTVELDRQDIAGLGDDSVVYEGTRRAHAGRRVDGDARASATRRCASGGPSTR